MKLRVAICQYDIEWLSPSQNLERIARKVASASADIVVLPEMFATGFVTHSDDAAQPMTGEIVSAMRLWAEQYGKAVTGSVAIREGAKIFNRQVFAMPEGEIKYYDKRHLFSIGGENENYTAGTDRTIIEWHGVRFMPLICYDLRFPVWSRCRDCDYDVLIYNASWPSSRQNVWQTLLAARAIENQAYVIGANRIGSDPVSQYVGGSAVIDFKGYEMAMAQQRDCTLCAELDIDALRAFRDKFAVWRDADNFELNPKR